MKWFLGEEIDEEKLEKTGTIIDDTARELIELSKNIAEDNKNQNKKQKKHRSEQGNGGSQTISEKPIDQQKPEVKVPSNNQVVESNNNLPIIEDNLPVAITPSLPIEEHLATPVISETKKSVPAEDASAKKVEVEDGKLSSNTNNTTTIPAAKTLEEGTAIKL